MTSHTASSAYRTIAVEIDDKGIVRTESGVLLGDVDGMTTLGWEFSSAVTVSGAVTGTVLELAAALPLGTYAAELAHPVTGRWLGELVIVSPTFAHFAPVSRVAA